MKKQRIFQKIRQLRNNTFHLRLDGGVVFLLLLFCPYIFTMYISKDVQNYQNKNITEYSETEEYLKGILPSVLPMEYEATAFQVQAILLRTLHQGGMLEEYVYMPEDERKKYFGEKAMEYEAKLTEAVESTAGLYLAYDGEPVEAAFCRLSAGNTRSGTEVLGDEYSYLQTVSCLEDMQSPEYQTVYEIEMEEFYKRLGIKMNEKNMELPKLITDSVGYVLWVMQEGVYHNGEIIAQKLELPSSNFTWEIENEKIHIICKGVGHGFGCSQYSVNELAKSGKNFEEILRYFFINVTIEKNE